MNILNEINLWLTEINLATLNYFNGQMAFLAVVPKVIFS